MNTTVNADFRQQMLDDVLEGLEQPQKELPSKYFYNPRGSELFDRITLLDEYYLTRTERSIMEEHIGEMCTLIGRQTKLIEFGSGSSKKIRLLLDNLEKVSAYIPVDISKDHLERAANELQQDYPNLKIQPVCADYTQPFELPDVDWPVQQNIVYYPGSTLGNFKPAEARRFLRLMAGLTKPDGGVLIGVDLQKDPDILERAYDDEQGVTEAFNKNILHHINEVLGANFDVDKFEHRAVYNHDKGRVEMHLVSRENQVVQVDDVEFAFKEGETIHTENSYKYTLESFEKLVSPYFFVEQVWTDPKDWFSVQFLRVL